MKKEYLLFHCDHCGNETWHEILRKTEGQEYLDMRISCIKCSYPSFTIDFPKALIKNAIKEFDVLKEPPNTALQDFYDEL